ncbi:MAG: efflux RND transporter periplasmic adaptor subunit [Lachnospiraceae bacterium]|nr:efflux RND transporter periplasmic adaptor subunit [Lachnospiraceae bacterium]
MKEGSGKLKNILKPTKKKVVVIVIVLIVLICGIYYGNTVKQAQATMAEPTYNTANVEKKDLKKEVSVNGTIGSVNKQTVESELANLEITQVNVKVGDVVKAGDVICTFDNSNLQKKLANAKETANLTEQKSKQGVTDAQTSYNNAVADKNTNASRNAQTVTDTYNGYQTAIAERDGANIAYQQAQTERTNAENAYRTALQAAGASNTDPATADGSICQAEHDAWALAVDKENTTSATLSTAQAKVVTMEAAYKDAVQKQQDTAITDDRTVAQQSAALGSAKLDAQAANTGETADTIDELQKQIDDCTIVAPIDGTITSLQVEAGKIYKGGEIAVIQDENNLLVNATVDQYTISDITEGMTTIIKTDTTGDLEMQGTLSFISPVPKSTIDGNGKTTITTDYEIEATFKEQNERLRLGMNAKTSILIAEAKNVLSVPGSCIQTDGDRKFVTVLVDETTGETKDIDVTTGLETDYDVEVKGEGLKEGMQVIVPDNMATDGTDEDDVIYG